MSFFLQNTLLARDRIFKEEAKTKNSLICNMTFKVKTVKVKVLSKYENTFDI